MFLNGLFKYLNSLWKLEWNMYVTVLKTSAISLHKLKNGGAQEISLLWFVRSKKDCSGQCIYILSE